MVDVANPQPESAFLNKLPPPYTNGFDETEDTPIIVKPFWPNAGRLDWVTKSIGITNFAGAIREWGYARENNYSILNVAQEFYRDVPWANIIVEHNGPNYIVNKALDEGYAFINKEISRGKRVIVHCAVGAERSPLMVANYLVEKGVDIDRAYRILKKKRPIVMDRWLWTQPYVARFPTPYKYQPNGVPQGYLPPRTISSYTPTYEAP